MLIFRPQARRKRPFRSQQCWLPVFLRGRKPLQDKYAEPSEAGGGLGLALGVQFPTQQVTFGPLPTAGLSAPLRPLAGPCCVGAVLTPMGGDGAVV